MTKLLLSAYHFFRKKPFLAFSSLIILTVLFVSTIADLKFSEDIAAFLPSNESNRRINNAHQHMNTKNQILVFISAKDSCSKDSVIQTAEKFVERLKQEDLKHLTSEIFYKIDNDEISEISDFIIKNAPYLLDESDYKRLDTLMVDNNRMEQEMLWNKEMLLSPTGSFLQSIIINDPVHYSNRLLKKLNGQKQSENFIRYNGYIFDHSGKELLITLTSDIPPSETSLNQSWVESISKTADFIEKNNPNFSVEHIGASEISIGNAQQIKTDTINTSIAALLLIVILLYVFYKDFRAILLILCSIAFGLVFALAFLSFFKEEVSLIAVGIASILVGIAANYPLHYLANRKEGNDTESTIKEIATPLIVGNATTVGAFLSLVFVSSDAMKDMGAFAALLLVGTIVFVLLFLPHFFKNSLFSQTSKEGGKGMLFEKLVNFPIEEKRIIVLSILILTIPLLFLSSKTSFDTDLHKINYISESQNKKLEKLIEQTEDGYSKTYCVCEGKSTEEALQLYERLRPFLDSLNHYEFLIEKEDGIGCFSPSQKMMRQRAVRWNSYWRENKDIFEKEMTKACQGCGFTKEFFAPFLQKINTPADTVNTPDFDAIRKITTDFYLYESQGQTLVYTILKSEPSDVKELTDALANIDPNIFTFNDKTLFNKMLSNLTDDFNQVLFVCAFIVFLFLCISFGRIELSLISFIPLTISWIWILGIMQLFEIRFNIVNMILATFIFGQGDDYTIFVTEGLMYEYTYGKKRLAEYKNSVMLSACIMFIGIGVLIFARHPALQSLAQVTIIGMAVVIGMAYVFPPLLCKWLTTSHGEKRLMPITLRNLWNTAMAFTVFTIGSLFLSTTGFFLLTIGGGSDKNKLRFHRLIQKTFKTLAKMMPNVPYHVSNEGDYDFSHPAILTCNHQSHLDLLYTLMLHPKIICLTNDWVWHCPFYGRIIRYADYYPISNGIEQSLDTLRNAVEKGYSILVFPEGTRSEDCEILRFHQGAFWLANQLHLDIVPVVIHGVGHVFPKKEFLLRKGRVDVRILPQINPSHALRTKADTKETARQMRNYYIEEYGKICEEIETAVYFKDLVYHNYIYKGVKIAFDAKKRIFNEEIEKQIASLPEEGDMEIMDFGAGEAALLTALVKKKLTIVANINDEDRYLIASNCASVPPNLKFRLVSKE